MSGKNIPSQQDLTKKTDEHGDNELAENKARTSTDCTASHWSAKPFSVTTEIDLIQWGLFLVALITRVWRLEHPRAVVFDELFYARYAAMYPRHTFYFDSQPPLGKMLIAAAGLYGGLTEDFKSDRIGAEYPEAFPVWYLRLVPALAGSLLAPLSYQIVLNLGFHHITAAIAAILVILDNALLCQSRYMLMELPMMFSVSLAFISYLKFKKCNNQPFSWSWWFWLLTLGTSSACAISMKYVAIFSVLLLVSLVCRDFWNILPHASYSTTDLWKHGVARILALVVLPVLLYTSVFYVHLHVLYKAGPHDDVMTSAFQASLEGGLASITKGQPLVIAYGSQITLRHTFSRRPCWLHSHQHVYPVLYHNNMGSSRGSSHQQQVTCYSFKDINNWWIIKHPQRNSLMVDEPLRPVKHGDLVQLIHGMTSRALNSHDVAAPVSPQHQEVSCYIDYNISFPAQNLWRVDIVNMEDGENMLKTIQSHVRFVHVNTSQALKTTSRQLPDWGFHQFEVVTDTNRGSPDTVWNVEEHRYTRTTDQETMERDLAKTEMIPLKPVQLSFWAKFWELQVKMLTFKKDVDMEHRYSSDPTEWPLMDRNIAYWHSPGSNAQVHLVGNLVVWLSGCVSVIIYGGLLVFYLLRRNRGCCDIEQEDWQKFCDMGSVLFVGYWANYVPYLLTEQTLFLHHYIPALHFKILLTAALLEHAYSIIGSVPYMKCVCAMLVLAWLSSVCQVFCQFLPFSYGSELPSGEAVRSLRWRPSWDFIQMKH